MHTYGRRNGTILKQRIKRKIEKVIGIQRRPMTVQIELAGKCSAACEFCDWLHRPKEQMIFMDTALAKKAVREAKELKADQISFHITGESLDHPDLFEILPTDYPILISTNCLSLYGDIAKRLAQMPNLLIILAVLWSEPVGKREVSILNARKYLDLHPINRGISLQMICSEHAVLHARWMYEVFERYFGILPNFYLFYKQPYTREKENPIIGVIPQGIPKHPRIIINYMPTPMSAGPDCIAFAPNPFSDILVQVDGDIKPCYIYRAKWGLGNLKDTSLKEAWNSKRMQEIRKILSTGDPDNLSPCHDCIRMATPKDKEYWWNTTGIPPTHLSPEQEMMGAGDPEPYPKV